MVFDRLRAQEQRCSSLFRRPAVAEHSRDPDLLRGEHAEVTFAPTSDLLARRVELARREIGPWASAETFECIQREAKWGPSRDPTAASTKSRTVGETRPRLFEQLQTA